ncbi:hypothetical protein HNP88_000431 [Methanococcus maripaludis]|uniref:Uncharacterized protein n=1 Tax=Methanococcus maripaludis TaxID=39152 RepID=A0A7J9NLC5_METMI|nr:hypothetical protein [Methanococcus maripaludis]MBA2846247.1 hypothetical protein [Methanococcus maripaludis]
MGKFKDYLKKNDEKIFPILEKILSFRFTLKFLLLPFIITVILNYFEIIPKDIVFYIYWGLLAVLGFYFFIFLIYFTLIAIMPKHLFNQDVSEGDVVLLIISIIVLISVMKVFAPNTITTQFIDYFIDGASGIGTFLVAIIAVLGLKQGKNQLIELEKQRKAQYKPELLAKDRLNIYFHNFEKVIEKYPAFNNSFVKDHLGVWSTSYKEPEYYEKMISEFLSKVKKNNNVADPFELEKVEMHIENNVYIEVYNIGKGFAKNIEYTWEIEHSKLFENFYKKYENDPLIYKMENEFVHSYYFGGTPSISLASNNKIRIDTYNLVTPYESSKEVLKIPLPWNLLKIMGLCSKKGGFPSLTTFPLKLHLNYQDIDGNPYLKTYEMRAYRIEPGRYSHYPKLLFTDNNDFMAYEFRIYEIKEETKETTETAK